ncbi:MAG: hypothetical protein KDK51_05170 [Deltaproteobacteria bacterium]|nr:hypothetical protein [Deltaproteobacteria bacterium]
MAQKNHIWAMAMVFFFFAGCRGIDTSYIDSSFQRPTWENHSPLLLTSDSPHPEVDCNICHGDYDTFRQFTCLTSSCHIEAATNAIHTDVTDYAFDSEGCFSCHPSGLANDISRQEHSASIFPISTGDDHGDLACVDCHIDIIDYTNVSCIDCHEHQKSTTDTQHSGIKNSTPYGYSYQTTYCLKCHPDSDVYAISTHNGEFKISSGTHRAQIRGCTDCHNKQRTDRSYIATDFTSFSCYGAGCHEHSQSKMNSKHSGVGGYSSSIFTNENWSACVNCHPDGEED